MNNPFETNNVRLTNIECLLLDLKHQSAQKTKKIGTDELLAIKRAGEFVYAEPQNLSGLSLKYYLYSMAINPYLNIETSSDFQVYEFESTGKDNIKKRVRFDLIDKPEQLYNLALCTILPDGSEDCETASRNGDMDRVLETTVHIAVIYINRFPERKVFFRGSNAVRSRKYQIGIARYLEVVNKDFFIEGLLISKQNEILLREPFQKGKNYAGFIFIRRK